MLEAGGPLLPGTAVSEAMAAGLDYSRLTTASMCRRGCWVGNPKTEGCPTQFKVGKPGSLL